MVVLLKTSQEYLLKLSASVAGPNWCGHITTVFFPASGSIIKFLPATVFFGMLWFILYLTWLWKGRYGTKVISWSNCPSGIVQAVRIEWLCLGRGGEHVLPQGCLLVLLPSHDWRLEKVMAPGHHGALWPPISFRIRTGLHIYMQIIALLLHLIQCIGLVGFI